MRTAAQVLLGLGFGSAAVVLIGLGVDLLGGESNPYVGFIPLTIMLLVAGTWVRIINGSPVTPGETINIRRRRRKDSE